MRIQILDDHPLYADALRQTVLRLGNKVLVDISNNVHQAIEYIDTGHHYDLMLVDLGLPGLDGFCYMRLLGERRVRTPVVAISADRDAIQQQKALQQGAMAFVHKSANARMLLAAIHTVLAGDIWTDDTPPGSAHLSPSPQPDEVPCTAFGISQRQMTILKLMEAGYSNKEIANQLDISESTVKTHVSRLIAALAVHNRTACVVEGRRLGLL